MGHVVPRGASCTHMRTRRSMQPTPHRCWYGQRYLQCSNTSLVTSWEFTRSPFVISFFFLHVAAVTWLMYGNSICNRMCCANPEHTSCSYPTTTGVYCPPPLVCIGTWRSTRHRHPRPATRLPLRTRSATDLHHPIQQRTQTDSFCQSDWARYRILRPSEYGRLPVPSPSVCGLIRVTPVPSVL